MNDYEARRREKIKQNQALLAELDIKPIVPRTPRDVGDRPVRKRRKFDTAPSRTSARIAATPAKPRYRDDPDIRAVAPPRSTSSRKSAKPRIKHELGSVHVDEPEPLVPAQDVDAITAGWTTWQAVADPPTRGDDMQFHFADHPDFTPNKSPEEVLKEGCFGGSYYRPLRSRRLGVLVHGDWAELPAPWRAGLDVARHLARPTYDPDMNKYKVACGQSIEEWEAAGWIAPAHDVRGWFQWYTRFFRGRRCADDARQVARWRKCVGPAGRWRRALLKKYVQAGVREVFDDGADPDAPEVSPVVHQTCHHWAYEVRQGDLDAYWESVSR